MRALNRKEIDRTPFYYRAEADMHERIKQAFDLKTDEDVRAYFGCDTMRISPVMREGYDIPDLTHVDTADDIRAAEWPSAGDVDIAESLRVARAARASGLAVYGGMWASIFTQSRRQMGEEKYLTTLALEPELIRVLVGRLADAYVEMNEAYLSACGDCLDIYYFGSDLGTQRSLFISPEAIRRCILPGMKRIVEHAKGFGLKVMFHTCGAVSEIIPDLIDIGVDILDPIQVSAADMDAESLAERFGGRIAFHGGIGTQKMLPFAAPEVVRERALHAVETLGPLGYIAAPDQNIQIDVPMENVTALFETLLESRL